MDYNYKSLCLKELIKRIREEGGFVKIKIFRKDKKIIGVGTNKIFYSNSVFFWSHLDKRDITKAIFNLLNIKI